MLPITGAQTVTSPIAAYAIDDSMLPTKKFIIVELAGKGSAEIAPITNGQSQNVDGELMNQFEFVETAMDHWPQKPWDQNRAEIYPKHQTWTAILQISMLTQKNKMKSKLEGQYEVFEEQSLMARGHIMDGYFQTRLLIFFQIWRKNVRYTE